MTQHIIAQVIFVDWVNMGKRLLFRILFLGITIMDNISHVIKSPNYVCYNIFIK
jgi:hypothetical protein